jgi:hypothetical protein
MGNPTNPMELMRRLDEAGTAYTVTLMLVGGALLRDCSVYSHTAFWLQVSNPDTPSGPLLWVSVNHVMLLEVHPQ